MRYTDNKIKEGLKVSDYQLSRFKLYNQEAYYNLISQWRLSRGKVFTIAKYSKLIKRG